MCKKIKNERMKIIMLCKIKIIYITNLMKLLKKKKQNQKYIITLNKLYKQIYK